MASGKRIRNTDELIVQFSTTGAIGSLVDVHLLYRFATILEASISRANIGYFDGTDVGGGKFNIYIYKILPSQRQQAAEVALSELRLQGLLDKAVIAFSVAYEAESDEWTEYEVIWPTNFESTFSVM
jgi:hypothetical protein